MSVKSALYFWLECDRCDRTSTEAGDHSAWADEVQAVDDAENGDWLCEPGLHLCWSCRQTAECGECGERKDPDADRCPDCASEVAGS